MLYKIIIAAFAALWVSAVCSAQTPGDEIFDEGPNRGSAFEEIAGFDLSTDMEIPDPPTSADCSYVEMEDGSFFEDCKYQEYTAASRAVPKWSVPYQVQLVTNKKGESDALLRRSFPKLQLWQARHICSGSLIHENWVLTAAHCIDTKIKPKGYGIRLKAESISEKLDDYIEVEQYIIHPNYQARPLENDVALVKLSERGTARDFVRYHPGLSTDKMDFWNAYITESGRRVITRPPDYRSSDYFTVWNAKNGKLIFTHGKQDDIPRSIEFDVKAGLIYGIDAREKGSRVKRIAETDRSHQITYFPETKTIATWSRNNDVRFWKAKSLRKLGGFKADVDVSNIEYFGPGIYKIYDERGSQHLFDAQAGKTHSTGRGIIVLSPDGSHFLQILDNVLALHDLKSGEVLKSEDLSSSGWDAYSSGDYLVLNSENNIRIIDPKTMRDLLKIDSREYNFSEIVGETAFALGYDNSFTAFELGSQKSLGRIKLTEKEYSTGRTEVFDQGKKLLVWLPEGRTKVWRFSGEELLYEINHSLPISNLKLTEDLKYILSYSEFGPTDVWSTADGTARTRIFHRGIQGMTYNKTCGQLLTWDGRGMARNWILKNGKNLAEFKVNSMSPMMLDIPEIAVIDLAKTEPEDGEQLWAYGWGTTRELSKFEPVSILRGITFSKISDQNCSNIFNKNRPGSRDLELGADEICAFDQDRKTCKGDSGGPITTFNSLVGVTSWSGKTCRADSGQPSVMASVAHFRDWIKSHVCDDPSTESKRPKFCTE